MQVESIHIEKRPSYDSQFPGQLVGIVHMRCSTGEQKLVLSPGALSRMFQVIAAEVVETSKRNAEMTKRGMQDAADGALILETTKMPAGTV